MPNIRCKICGKEQSSYNSLGLCEHGYKNGYYQGTYEWVFTDEDIPFHSITEVVYRDNKTSGRMAGYDAGHETPWRENAEIISYTQGYFIPTDKVVEFLNAKTRQAEFSTAERILRELIEAVGKGKIK